MFIPSFINTSPLSCGETSVLKQGFTSKGQKHLSSVLTLSLQGSLSVFSTEVILNLLV